MSEELEYVGLVLEDQLLDHLATPAGAQAIWRERLPLDVIFDSDAGVRDALQFVIEYMDEYRTPPDISVLSEETGYDEFNEPVAPVEYVIDKLRDRYQRKVLRGVVTKMGRLSGQPDESLNYGLEELTKLKVATAPVGSMITSDDFGGTLADYERRKENPSDGLSFGYEMLDMHLAGLMVGELYVVLARPKRYKSWQLLKSAFQNYVVGEKNIFVETMEMPEEEMRNRFHCMIAQVSWYRFKHGHLTEQDKAALIEVGEEIKSLDHKITFHRSKIGERKVPLIVELAKDAGAEVLYIDQLSWFDGAKDEGSWRIIGQIMEQLKDAASNFPIMMAAQYNRAQAQETHIGDLANIALADAVGQTADMLLGIYASRDMLENKLIHYGVVDSRNFEPVTWEIGVRLTEKANFDDLNVVVD
jgi:KaiC/GvpD/RAD55 family RecA-like ATPase